MSDDRRGYGGDRDYNNRSSRFDGPEDYDYDRPMRSRDASYGRGNNYGNYHNEYSSNYRTSSGDDSQNDWGNYSGASSSYGREDDSRRFGGDSGRGYAPSGGTYNPSTYEPGQRRGSGRRHGGGELRSSGRGDQRNYGGSSYREGYDYGYTGGAATSRTRAGSRSDFGMGYASSHDSWDRIGRSSGSLDGSRSMAYNPAFPDDHASDYESGWQGRSDSRGWSGRSNSSGWGGSSTSDWSTRGSSESSTRRSGGRGMRGRGPSSYKRKPDRIEDEINEMLTDHHEIDATDVRVSADENGIITLRGSVDSRRTKRAVEHVADQARGVRDVRNELEIDESFFEKFMHGVDRFLNRDSEMNEATSGSVLAKPDADAPADDTKAPSSSASASKNKSKKS